MDIRITKKRLNDHLSYDWWKYLAIIVACIFFWSLIFTMSAPRLAASKKYEIFFIADGYTNDNYDKIVNGLKESISKEIIEITFNNYFPGDSTTAQVLSAKTAVKEGDIYVFPYTPFTETQYDASNDTFGRYVDSFLFADFTTLINEAKQFGEGALDYQTFKSQVTDKKVDTEEEYLAEYGLYNTRLSRAKDEAIKLENYIHDYPVLFRKYEKFTVINTSMEEGKKYETEEEKIWGLDFNAFVIGDKNTVSDTGSYGFIWDSRGINPQTGTAYPLNIAMGIVSFKEDNMPLYYENIAAINYFIEQYYVNLLS